MASVNSSKYVDSRNKHIGNKYTIELITHSLLNQIIDAFNFISSYIFL